MPLRGGLWPSRHSLPPCRGLRFRFSLRRDAERNASGFIRLCSVEEGANPSARARVGVRTAGRLKRNAGSGPCATALVDAACRPPDLSPPLARSGGPSGAIRYRKRSQRGSGRSRGNPAVRDRSRDRVLFIRGIAASDRSALVAGVGFICGRRPHRKAASSFGAEKERSGDFSDGSKPDRRDLVSDCRPAGPKWGRIKFRGRRRFATFALFKTCGG